MDFILLTLGMVGLLVLVLVLLARAYPGSGADLLDWKPTRSYEDEAILEEEDIQQMMDAQNAYRRRRGAGDLRRMAEVDEEARSRGRRFAELNEVEEEFVELTEDEEDLGT